MQFTLTTPDYGVLCLYFIALFMTGFYLNRYNRAAGRDIFLGGRSLRWWQIGFSMFSANAGPSMLVGFASIGFTQGVVGSNFEWLAWAFLFLLSMFFLPHYISTKVSTMPQFLLVRFGKPSYNFLVIYSLISILVVWLGSALYAGGLIISQVFDISLLHAVLTIAVIASSFTAVGGLKAVVRTGIFQSLIIILSSIILGWLALKKIGGIQAFTKGAPADYWKLFRPASDPQYSWIAILLGYPVVGIYYWCTDQTIVQKVLAAKDVREGQYGAIFISFLKIIMPFIFIFPGIMCFVLYRDIAQPDNAYITLVTQVMPHGLLGLCIAALIAALIDTVSSGLNSFSTVFTLDVLSRVREMDDRAKRRTGQWSTLLAAVLAVGVAWLFSLSGKGFFELSQGLVSILAPPLSVVFVGGISWKRVNKTAAEVVLYGGGLVCLLVGACHVLNFPSKAFWPHFLLLSFYLFLAMLIVLIGVTLCTKPPTENVLPSIVESWKERAPGSRRVWVLWALLALVMGAIYIYFS
ncbi:SSS family solute:Na+ symporter [Chitinophaga polysaccharea]|uniref:SSS family solute:Na+ symporter n=1 Tax=Chitinophaga polysaccharea TaxID=1293035 RepID=A0A561P3W6_9BACT|nr:sodium/solute symporter [Chitinophaga polysaccharea]TWF32811.1 SSS family solute:Na+ symporter [Chitinophaga polysaccharea]